MPPLSNYFTLKPFHKDINIFKSEWDRLHFQSARDDGHRLCLRAKKGDFCTGDDTSAAITSYQGRLTVIGMASIRQKNCKKSGNGSLLFRWEEGFPRYFTSGNVYPLSDNPPRMIYSCQIQASNFRN